MNRFALALLVLVSMLLNAQSPNKNPNKNEPPILGPHRARGVRYQLSAPTIMHDPTRGRFPFPVRVILGFVGANDFMQLSACQAPAIAH